jgi:hypothetical protein
MRSIKPIRMKKAVRANRSAHPKQSNGAAWWTGAPAVAGAVIGLMIVAVVGAVYESSDRPTVARVQTHRQDTTPPPEAAPATEPARVPDAARGRAAAMAIAETPAAEAAAVENTSSVTITGCLERTDETFRLRDAAGVQVPKARRSWKSGFLKKSSASVDVVPAANRLNLSNHVGERVSVTGTLVDREMRVRSVQRVAASCAGTAKVRT